MDKERLHRAIVDALNEYGAIRAEITAGVPEPAGLAQSHGEAYGVSLLELKQRSFNIRGKTFFTMGVRNFKFGLNLQHIRCIFAGLCRHIQRVGSPHRRTPNSKVSRQGAIPPG